MLGAPAGRTNWRDKKKKEEIFKKVFVRISSLVVFMRRTFEEKKDSCCFACKAIIYIRDKRGDIQ